MTAPIDHEGFLALGSVVPSVAPPVELPFPVRPKRCDVVGRPVIRVAYCREPFQLPISQAGTFSFRWLEDEITGSDSTHIAGRLTNGPLNLMAWIQSPRSIDPGTLMPDLGVSKD